MKSFVLLKLLFVKPFARDLCLDGIYTGYKFNFRLCRNQSQDQTLHSGAEIEQIRKK